MPKNFIFTTKEISKKNRLLAPFVFFSLVLTTFTVLILWIFSPVYLNEPVRVTIPEGYSITKTAQTLEEAGVIRVSQALVVMARLENISLKAGTYLFEDTQTLSEVTQRLRKGDYGDVYTRITIPEGSNNKEIEKILQRKLENFNSEMFRTLTKSKEGYLFPDTYAVLPETNTESMVKIMEQEFRKKIAPLAPALAASKRSLEDIVIMASLIEKEAGNNNDEQKIVSGILWKRLDKGMALQVDAPFLYIQGKTSAQLSIADLRKDGPYNTYTRTGLPPTAIGNPGMNALVAALHPKSSLYFYYLHDTKGGIHYGVTHDEHVRNKQRYLK